MSDEDDGAVVVHIETTSSKICSTAMSPEALRDFEELARRLEATGPVPDNGRGGDDGVAGMLLRLPDNEGDNEGDNDDA